MLIHVETIATGRVHRTGYTGDCIHALVLISKGEGIQNKLMKAKIRRTSKKDLSVKEINWIIR